MAEQPPKLYQKLPGTGRRIGRSVQLWLGADHLLVVARDGYREQYKRFRYQDIRVLSVYRTIEGKVTNGCLGFAVFAFGAMALAAAGEFASMVIMLIFAGFFALLLIGNVLAGPWCKCRLGTAVQTEELVSLRRLRRAEKVIDRLRPLIIAAQGEMSAEAIQAQLQQNVAKAAATPNAPPLIGMSPAVFVKPPPRPYQSEVHFIFFCALLADLPLTACDVFYTSTFMTVLYVLVLLAVIGLGITALVKQHNTNLPTGLRRIPWIWLIFNAAILGATMVHSIGNFIRNGGSPASTSILDDPVNLMLTMLSTALSVALGAIGILQLRRFRATQTVPTSPPPPTL